MNPTMNATTIKTKRDALCVILTAAYPKKYPTEKYSDTHKIDAKNSALKKRSKWTRITPDIMTVARFAP